MSNDRKLTRRRVTATAIAATATAFVRDAHADSLCFDVGQPPLYRNSAGRRLELSEGEAVTLLRAMSDASRKRLLRILADDGLIARCHWVCSTKNHGQVGGPGPNPMKLRQ